MNSDSKDLIIHIGLAKTGTTTIQNFLYKNRKKLLEYNILYPDVAIWNNSHTLLTGCFVDTKKDFCIPQGDLVDLNNYLKNFDNQLEVYQPSLTILSAESFSFKLKVKHLIYFISKLKFKFNNITLLLTNRGLDSLSLASFKNLTRVNPKRNYIEFYFQLQKHHKTIYNYWTNTDFPIIVKKLENCPKNNNLTYYYFGDIFEKYNNNAALLLKNSKEEILNKNPFPTHYYLLLLLYDNCQENIPLVKEFKRNNNKYLETTDEQLTLYFKYFQNKSDHKEKISWEEKTQALRFAGII
jgi:hypothetical protein